MYTIHYSVVVLKEHLIKLKKLYLFLIIYLMPAHARRKELIMEFKRTNVDGGSAFEKKAGYSRIVIAGPFVYVSGTTAVTPEGTVYGEGDAYAQAHYIFEKLVNMLAENGIKKEEVVKVNIYTIDPALNGPVTDAFSEFFSESKPACTWLGIKGLNRPTQMVEIELQAIKGCVIE